MSRRRPFEGARARDACKLQNCEPQRPTGGCIRYRDRVGPARDVFRVEDADRRPIYGFVVLYRLPKRVAARIRHSKPLTGIARADDNADPIACGVRRRKRQRR